MRMFNLCKNKLFSTIYAFDQMDIQADYRMEVVYLADNRREQRIVADGNEVQGPVVLEKGKEQRYMIDLPKKAYAYDRFGAEPVFVQSGSVETFRGRT